MKLQSKGQRNGPNKGKNKKQFGGRSSFKKSSNAPKTRKQMRKSMRAKKKAQRAANISNSLMKRSGKFARDESVQPYDQIAKKNKLVKSENEKVVGKLGKFVKKHVDIGDEEEITQKRPVSDPLSSQASIDKSRSKTKRLEKNLKIKMLEQRKKCLLEENEREDILIKSLEKQLRLDKRKNKSLPGSFKESGLDYILDAVNSEKVGSLIDAEKKLTFSDSEFEDDLDDVMGINQERKSMVKADGKRKGKLAGLEEDESDFDGVKSDVSYGDGDENLDDSDDSETVSKKMHSNRKTRKASGSDDNEGTGFDSDEENFNPVESESEGSELDDLDDSGSDDQKVSNKKSKNGMKGSNIAGNSDSDDYSEFQDIDSEPDDILEEENKNKKEKVKKTVTFGPEVKNEGSVSRKRANDKKLKNLSKRAKNENSDQLFENDESSHSGDEVDDSSEYWEDIYGRKRDKQGNVVEEKAGKYIPPHLRMKNVEIDSKKKEELERLKRQLKGLLNRLAENNMHKIASEIEDLYMRNSRNDMNETLLQLLYETAGTPIITPERLIMEHAMLMAILHANVGTEVGAHVLQNFVSTFDDLLKENIELSDKRLENILTFICHLYTFKVFDASLLYDILDKLRDGFTEKKVDLILVILRCVGFTLRKDDPASLKNLVLQIQQQAGKVENLKGDSRVRFMLDILLTIKNNNMSKLPQYDPTHAEHLKKILKTMIRKGNYVTELKISLEDLLKADERGKWWIVGSAWNGPAPSLDSSGKNDSGPVIPTDQRSAELSKLAKKLSINTDSRRSIFFILMTAEDYMDAFEKLDKLGMTNFMVREICFIILHCLLSEKEYNKYYALVAQMLCRAHRRNLMTLQCSLWDKIKEVESLKNYQITNLAKFLAFLFLEGTLAISILKVIPFAEMTKPCVKLVRQVLLTVMCHSDSTVSLEVFARLTKSDQLKMFREAVRLFLHCFLLPKLPEGEPGSQEHTLRDMMLKIDTMLRNDI